VSGAESKYHIRGTRGPSDEPQGFDTAGRVSLKLIAASDRILGTCLFGSGGRRSSVGTDKS